ncbi:hypothetical protein CVT25_003667 [Psilocybe cyanescens]|uniref:CCHC-type domain-containing protein n=1 Tax=Psilocybe cyanescens TaxID=93625 RepID=A0A409WZV7_PSICY|nr:hypothetical protein CVT25_003667 [Psilocybe cyanescens]
MGSEPTTVGGGGDTGEQAQELTPTFFYHSSAEPIPHLWELYGVYERADAEVLGESIDDTTADPHSAELAQSRCFNCGDPDHKVTECRFRLNRELIALSRQYYQFKQGTLGLGNWQRIHDVESWRQQRLNWLEEFEPGKIKGELLKEALGTYNEEWLRNISVWGYPPGWVSEIDPRERVKMHIWNEVHGDVEDELDDSLHFEIHGDDDRIEQVKFGDAFKITHHSDTKYEIGFDSQVSPSRRTSSSESPSSSDKESPNASLVPVRWANYPPSHFSSQHLVPYKPPPPAEPWSSTLFEDTAAYLHQFSFYHYNSQPPPPPSEEPPPLPPSSDPPPPPSMPPLPSSPPPPPPFSFPPSEIPGHAPTLPSNKPSHHELSHPVVEDDQADLSECDMDLSDSD